ncbi:hypothetical protein E3P92_02372 [Wallemia ichthyophaga]|nr:hypothetical protein E3P97_02314 [Wallemia ichthyophaga]TIA99772.1 hypothetical protein E3P95_01938 [Wallemia ichthyophaga]TIB00797.1 hypothetical protein E3P94_02062 [Wallemia ichthyophaga]TIB06583.1 hypothetical protein E3P96_00284 [Wallemia ichthyophaga]TIB13159.1 hypothetical protein E3P92_02372 [Wallemia ichthyophaga]
MEKKIDHKLEPEISHDSLPEQRAPPPKTLTQKLENPLKGIPHDKLYEDATAFAHEYGLGDDAEKIAKGALVAQDPKRLEMLSQLTDDDKEAFRRESTHKLHQTRELWLLVACCSVGAVVQGMDETVINGAQLFYPQDLNINPDVDVWLFGLVNSAPYLACAVLGCWLTSPLNRFFGRRGTIMITAFLSFATCIWSAVTNSWQHLFVSRLVLGLGIGPKSATVPVFAAETTPANIRGALVMMWQFWTAFGIMSKISIIVGFVADLIFYHVKDTANIDGLNWRLMLGSAGIPALVVMGVIPFIPESPRYLMGKGKKNYPKALRALKRLRPSDLQAARDIYYIHICMTEEMKMIQGKSAWFRFLELFTIPRNRRATAASAIVMFGQQEHMVQTNRDLQFCGINVCAYYSSNIFVRAGFSELNALLASWGFGMINFLFAIPGFFTIDRYGRRALLLIGYPTMCAMLLVVALGFLAPFDKQIIPVAIGVYLFTVQYSYTSGPVPFTYSAEVFPLSHRNLGMSLATAILWLFNFILSITFPALQEAFTSSGAFGWYAAWCAALFCLAFLFVPETKSLTLEELDQVFSTPTRVHIAYQFRQIPWFINRYLFGRKLPKEELYVFDEEVKPGEGSSA